MVAPLAYPVPTQIFRIILKIFLCIFKHIFTQIQKVRIYNKIIDRSGPNLSPGQGLICNITY